MGDRSTLEIRKRETFKTGIIRLLDSLHDESAKYIMARSRQHISIHEMRKNIKKIRAILRLIRHEIGHEKYHELNDYYRNIARSIAVLRDDTSQIELLESMKKKVDAKDIRRTLSKAIRQIEKKRKQEFDAFYAGDNHNLVRGDILRQKELNHQLPFSGDPDYFILKSLRRIHRRARSAMEVSTFLKHDEVYHYWRKQVKYLMYQLNILNNAWPGYFKTYISELNRLSNLLGKLHDLNLFNQHLHEGKLVKLNPRQKAGMLKIIYQKRAAMKKKISKTGERIFAESSEAFSLRVYDIWMNSVLNKEPDTTTSEDRKNRDENLLSNPKESDWAEILRSLVTS